MSSQKSFQSIAGKFSDGLEVLKGIIGYNPSKEELKIASLETLKADVTAKNAAVVSTGSILKDLRDRRRIISFRAKDGDQNCIENLIKNIQSYIKAELGSKSPVYSQIDSIIKRIQPPSDKKEELKEGEEPKKSKSSSEKSYQALVGFGYDVITAITNLGTAYNPSNTNITLANFKTKIDELASLNAQIVKADGDYTTAVDARDEVYNGESGIANLNQLIKSYLASMEGGKKSAGYNAFVNAVK